MASHPSTVDQIWSELVINPERRDKFLSSRAIAESHHIECKASVLTEPLYDRLLALNKDFLGSAAQEYPHERQLTSDKFLHENLFAAMVAIASMANLEDGGIVLFGVASKHRYGLTWDELFSQEPGMPTFFEASTMRQRYKLLNEGIELGNILVTGIDHELPPEGVAAPVDARLDRYEQMLRGQSSPLFVTKAGRYDLCEKQLWYCIGVYDFIREGANKKGRPLDKDKRLFLQEGHEELTYPIAKALPWRSAKWSPHFCGDLVVDSAILPVTDGDLVRHIFALKIKGLKEAHHEPVYYQTYPDGYHKKCSKDFSTRKRKISCSRHEMEKDKQSIFYPIRHGCQVQPLYADCLQTVRELLNLGRFTYAKPTIPAGTEPSRSIDHEDLFDATQEDTIDFLVTTFIPRSEPLIWIDSFLSQRDRHCFLLTGDPGGGKSALAAYIASGGWRKRPAVIYHFINKGLAGRRSWRRIVISLLFQVNRIVNLGEAFLEDLTRMRSGAVSDEEILEIQHNKLQRANKLLRERGEDLLVVVDGLDEMEESAPFFIPEEPKSRIKYLVTSRVGSAVEILKKHLGRFQPETYHLPEMDLGDMQQLCAFIPLDLTTEKMKLILRQTTGNAFYLTRVLARIKANPAFNPKDLSEDILYFIKKDLAMLIDNDGDGILARAMSLVLVAARPLSPGELQEILTSGRKQIDHQVLRPLLPFLQRTEQLGTPGYTFSHQLIAASLRDGDSPLINEEDLANAHRQIITWCEPAIDDRLAGGKHLYATAYLPAHHWALGELNNDFTGFKRLLEKDSVNCELVCRAFLRERVLNSSQEQLLGDRKFNDLLANLYRQGNKTARTTLYRFSYDLDGFGYERWKEEFWEDIFAGMMPSDPLYDELFTHSTFPGKKENKRLQIAIDRLEKLGTDHSSSQVVRLNLLLTIAGGHCIRDRSGELYDPEKAGKILQAAQDLVDKLTIGDFLKITHNDPQYARWLLLMTKGSKYNDMGFYLNQIGKILQGIALYEQSGDFYRQALGYAPGPYLEARSRLGVYLNDANLGATLFWLCRFSRGLHLLIQALTARLHIGQRHSAVVSLNNIIQLLHSLDFEQVTPFLTSLASKLYPNGTRQSKITTFSNVYHAWLIIGDLERAGKVLSRLLVWYAEIGSPFAMFSACNLQLSYYAARNTGRKCEELAEQCLSMLDSATSTEVFVQKTSMRYYSFWKNIVLTRLLQKEPQAAWQVVKDKLLPWFEDENFFFTHLKPRFLLLQSKVKEELGESAQSERLFREAQRLVDDGRKQIAGVHFPFQLMEQMDLLVDEYVDEELTELYRKVRKALAEDLTSPNV